MFSALSTILIFCLVFLLSFSGMTLVVWLMARLLMFIFPLSIFEAMLLSSIFSSFGAYNVWKFSGLGDMLDNLNQTADLIADEMQREKSTDSKIFEELATFREYERDTYKFIPNKRFYDSSSQRTWENWLLKEIANDIYAEFQHKTNVVPNLNETQSQELAIRLAEFGINILKRKTARARKLTITKNQLVREIEKNGQRAYDDMIIKLAVSAQNMNIDYYYQPLLEVVHNKHWQQPATINDDA